MCVLKYLITVAFLFNKSKEFFVHFTKASVNLLLKCAKSSMQSLCT